MEKTAPAALQFRDCWTTVHAYGRGEVTAYGGGGFVQILHILEGALRLDVDGVSYVLSPGETGVVNPYERGKCKALSDVRLYGFIFDAARHFDDTGLPPLCRFEHCVGADERVAALCAYINEEYETHAALHEKMLMSLTNELCVLLYRHYRAQSAGGREAFEGSQRIVREALRYINDHPDAAVSTRDVSAAANVSTAYLCRCFKEVTGKSVLDYAETLRMRRAHEDLTLGIYSVSDVAHKYGYNGLSYFNRRYKKHYGKNPGSTLKETAAKREKQMELPCAACEGDKAAGKREKKG